jgi:seryl-tRNA synthetase
VLDLRLIRRDPEAVRTALARRGPDAVGRLDRVVELDTRWREATQAAEALRAEQKSASEEVAAGKRDGRDVSATLEHLKVLSGAVKSRGEQAREAETELQDVLRALPIDMQRGARLSGARFPILRGDLVMLELALVQWVLDKLRGHGFEPVIPPVLVREQALFGTGMLPDTEQQIYRLPDDDLYLVGTSEVALASMHAGEILDAADLPVRYAGFSPCFRREAGAAGKDTRGIFRVHQFDKVEMFSFVAPQDGAAEHERLLAIEEEIFSELEVPYRVVNIAVDDLGSSAAKKYDIEAWLPGQGRYREVTSTSNTTDFQARRLEIRMRRANGKPEVLHTLNGTAVAVSRTLMALLENGQRDDGSVTLPAVLRPFGAPVELPAAGRA